MKKYIKGEEVRTLEKLMNMYLKNTPIIFRKKYLPAGFWGQWSFKTLESYIEKGWIYTAKEKK